jgi:hypothetical protein
LAYDFDIVAWEGFPRRGQSRGNRYPVAQDAQGAPILPRVNRVHGIHVILTNPDRRGDTHRFWLFSLQRFTKWDQWWALVIATGTRNYEYEFSDDPMPPDPLPQPGPG